MLFLLGSPERTAVAAKRTGFFPKQAQVECRSEPPVCEQIFDFLRLHALKAWLQIPNVAHSERETFGNGEMLACLVDNLLPSGMHRLNRRFSVCQECRGAPLRGRPVKRCEQKGWRDRTLISHSLIRVAERKKLQVLGRLGIQGVIDTPTHQADQQLI